MKTKIMVVSTKKHLYEQLPGQKDLISKYNDPGTYVNRKNDNNQEIAVIIGRPRSAFAK